ncbi:MAG: aromatic amino acid transport family protein [Myxococcota bacterium]
MQLKRVAGAALLIAGTGIGAGMLVMPLVTGLVGFPLAVLFFVAMWLLMLWCADLVVETTLAMSQQGKQEVNLVRMARSTLGPLGEAVTWCSFLLLFYTLVAAYMKGSGQLVSETTEAFWGWSLPAWQLPWPILVLCVPAVGTGFGSVQRLNRYLMIGLAVAFVMMLATVFPFVQLHRLLHVDLRYAWGCVAVIMTGFAYHVMVPSLVHYLQQDTRSIRLSIALGSLIPLVVYIVLELVVLAAVPVDGRHGLADLLHQDLPLAAALRDHAGARNAMSAFTLLAIVTSFLGVSMGLQDFLRDGLGVRSRFQALVYTFAPPLLLIWVTQSAFVTILEYAGAFVALLHGILPAAMVLALRRNKQLVKQNGYRAWGSEAAISAVMITFVGVIVLVFAKNLGWIVLDLSTYLPMGAEL